MAFNFRYTRYSAMCHLILGGLCVIFGIADRASMYKRDAFHTEGVIAIWMGAWFFATGLLGWFATQRLPNSDRPRTPLVGTYMAFSIVATVFAGVIIICYGIGIAIILEGGSCSQQSRGIYRCKSYYPYDCSWDRVSHAKQCRTSVGLGAMIIIFAIAEFGVSIWASICCCMGYNGCCNTSTPQMQGQIVYLQTQGGPVAAYVMTQGPNGMPVAVPAMTGGPVYQPPNQAVGGQAYMMSPQGTTAVTPTQYVQGAGGQVHVQNPQGAPAMTPTQQVQGVPTSVAQQQVVTTQHAFNAPNKV